MRAEHGELVELVERAIAECGPMTRAEIERHAGIELGRLSRILTRMTSATSRTPQRLHISGWVRDADGLRNYLRAVYALGPGKHKPKPEVDREKMARASGLQRYRRTRLNSIFNVGKSAHAIRAKVGDNA